MATVGEVLALLNEIAPLALCEEWDNVGLLIGSRAQEVTGILCALDLTDAAVDAAIRCGANLIVTHHPVMFRGRKTLTDADPEGACLLRLIREGMAHIAMHTNFDAAHPGVNDALAARLNLTPMVFPEGGMVVGTCVEMRADVFRDFAEAQLCDAVRFYGVADKPIRTVAVMGGSGGDFGALALQNGADAFVTGEIGYHRAEELRQMGLVVLECGHAATERPSISLLGSALQEKCNALQYRLNVINAEEMT